MVISIDHQDIYGMHVSECYVRDGLGWSDQGLINDEGICLHFSTAGEKIYKSPGKKLVTSKLFFREIASLAVLNFFPVQKMIFGHF